MDECSDMDELTSGDREDVDERMMMMATRQEALHSW